MGGWWRADRVLVCLILIHLVIKLALLPRAAESPLYGDEGTYVDGARALSNLVRDAFSLTSPDRPQLAAGVVGNGWFMPGMSIVLTPLFLVDPQASLFAIRAYLGVFTLLLLIGTVLMVRRVLGRVYAWALMVFPSMLPLWIFFSYAVWGDLAAGLLVVVLVLLMVRAARTMRAGRSPTLLDGFWLGMVGIATLNLRSSALPLVLGLFALVLLGLVFLLRGRRPRLRALASLAVAVAVFVGLLLPWSIAASRTLGDRVVTTTTVPLSLAVAFGDVDELCFGPCDPGNIWVGSVRYSREVARVTGVSELEVQQEMSDYALRDTTRSGYATGVLDDLNRYLLQPAGFEEVFRGGAEAPDDFSDVVIWTTRIAYFAMMAFALWALLMATRASFDAQITSLLVKLTGAALLIQPFVHICSPRYWPVFAPLFAIALGLLVQVVREWRAPPPDVERDRTTTVLFWLQVVVSAGFVAVGVVLVSVAS